MTPQEKKQEQDWILATIMMKGIATVIIATLVIAGIGLILTTLI